MTLRALLVCMDSKKGFARNILNELLRKEKRDIRQKPNIPKSASDIFPQNTLLSSIPQLGYVESDTPKISELDELRHKYNSLREENNLKLSDAEKKYDERLHAEVEKISAYEIAERENIAREELIRYTSVLEERRATYARDYESYQKKVLKDMEWKYCRRSFIPDCNCKKCYRKKMGIPTRKKKESKKSETKTSENKKSEAKIPENKKSELKISETKIPERKVLDPINGEKKVEKRKSQSKIHRKDPKESEQHSHRK